MRILIFSDIHGSERGFSTTIRMIEKYNPDLVAVCGDITNFGPGSWAEKYLDKIPARTFAVPGNCDPRDLDRVIEKTGAVNLHLNKTEFSGLSFIGAGGADYTPFNTPFEFPDDTFKKWLNPLMEKNSVLITHAPAYGTVDFVRTNDHLGSRSLRKIIERWEPILALSGHFHKARGILKLGKTVCVNPGPAKLGFGAMIELKTPKEILSRSGNKVAENVIYNEVRKSVKGELLSL